LSVGSETHAGARATPSRPAAMEPASSVATACRQASRVSKYAVADRVMCKSWSSPLARTQAVPPYPSGVLAERTRRSRPSRQAHPPEHLGDCTSVARNPRTEWGASRGPVPPRARKPSPPTQRGSWRNAHGGADRPRQAPPPNTGATAPVQHALRGLSGVQALQQSIRAYASRPPLTNGGLGGTHAAERAARDRHILSNPGATA